MKKSVHFEVLQSHHDRQGFNCGNPVLDRFLHVNARQNADRNVGVTHIAVRNEGDSQVLAYYTLVTRAVKSEIVPSKKLPTGDVGVVLLGRLAVDIKAQGMRLGKLCLTRAIIQVAQAADEIGLYALVLDAIDERARAWYLSLDFGFKPFLDDPNHLFLTVETIRQCINNRSD